MRKNYLTRTLLLVMMMVFAGINAWAEEVVYYTLIAKQSTSNTAYANYYNVTINGMGWNAPGNQNFEGYWRIGGKSLSNVNRTITANDKMASAISKVAFNHKGVSNSNLIVNSIKLTVASDNAYNDIIETVSAEFVANTITFKPSTLSEWPKDAYYKLTLNVSNKNNSNYGVDFTSLVFYADDSQGDNPATVTAPKFDVAAGTYTEDQFVHVNNYDCNYLYFYTTDGTTPACDEELNATGTSQVYDNGEGIKITESCTLKMIAVDEDGNKSSVTSAAYVINKPIVFTSLEELVAADITTGTNVTVSFENVPIKSFYTNSSNVRTGLFFDIQKGGKDIEIYYYGVPSEWEVGGTLSGTMTCPWKNYNGTWELAPASGWSWANLTYKPYGQKTITELAVSGTPTKTAYYDGDVFETDGLVVTATYSDGSDEVITKGIEWTVAPETLTLETTTVDVKASVGSVVSEVYTVNVTVAANPYKTAKVSSFTEYYGLMNKDIYYEARKGGATSDPFVTNGCLRLYQNGGYVNIKATRGLKINSVKITTSSTYASTTVGYCVDDEDAPTTGETVAKSSDYTISNLNNNSVSIYCLGTDNKSRLEISAIEVKYSGEAAKELRSIALSGTYPTEFTKGDDFSHEGMVVTATYTDATEKDVTSSAAFTGYDMNTIGEQTVTVSYTEEDVTKTAEYKITVNKAPFVPVPVEEGYEIVNFASLYSQVTTNAVVEDYEGTSFAMTFAKPQSSTTTTRYYDNGKAVRAYKGNTITITAAETIKDVDIAWADGYMDMDSSIHGLGSKSVLISFESSCRFTAIGVAYASETLSTNANGVASYVTSLPTDFTEFEDLTAYLCTATSSETVTLEKAGKVPAGTALVVVGNKSESYYLPFTASATAVENLFLAGEYTVQEGDYVYALNTQGQFQKVGTGVTIPARKAYLKTEQALSKTISIFDVDETTGIASVNNEAVKTTACKVIVNGQLRIVTPNGMFTTTGAQVK